MDSARSPYIHLVDGGVSDNVGMRGVLEVFELLQALHEAGIPTPLDHVKRIVVLVVNSLSTPPTTWNEKEGSPDTLDVLLKAAGTPIDHYSYEAVELLKDISARWETGPQGPEPRRMRAERQFSHLPDSPRTGRGALCNRRLVQRVSRHGASALTSISNRRPSYCRPRLSIGCALRRERSCWLHPSSSGC
jgi:hypothetical protein